MSLSLVRAAPEAAPQATPSDSAGLVSLVSLMERVSAELGELADATERMHVLVDRAPGERRDADYVSSAQAIDRSQQILAALSTFLAELSHEVDGAVTVDLADCLQRIPLADLKRRLLPDTATPPPISKAGEIELF